MTAWAPTTVNSTCSSAKATNSSMKSRVAAPVSPHRARFGDPIPGRREDGLVALPTPEFAVEGTVVGFSIAQNPSHDNPLHSAQIIVHGRRGAHRATRCGGEGIALARSEGRVTRGPLQICPGTSAACAPASATALAASSIDPGRSSSAYRKRALAPGSFPRACWPPPCGLLASVL